MNHDVKAMVAMLRDHLAAHDRPISFLFGAGTSCAVNLDPQGFKPLIPAVAGLTDACKAAVEAMGPGETAGWEHVHQDCLAVLLPPNIESILGRIRAKLEALTNTEVLGGLTKAQWEAVDATIRRRIAQLASPSATDIPAELPHHAFARWTRNTSRRCPIEVFTTNYDILFEASFDQLRVPHFDGFVGSQFAYFSPETVENDLLMPSPAWVRFWKLHGSVSWTMERVRSEYRITRGRANLGGEMILPSHRKYDESRKQPYRSLMDRLAKVLAREDSLLVSCGFSFSDQHINAVVLDAVEQHPRTHVIILCYLPLKDTDELVRWACQFPNILVIGPNAGVVSGRYGTWIVSGKPDAQLAEASGNLIRLDQTSATGFCVQAGDFNRLCGFLTHMDGNRRGGTP